MNNNSNTIIKVGDVCSLFSVTDETVYRWIKNRNLPAYRIGKEWYFKRDEIEQWLIEQNTKNNKLEN